MNNQKIVDKQIQDEYDKFIYSIYNDDVPEKIIELFKRAIFFLPAYAHKLSFHKIKSIADKKTTELTVEDLSNVIKVVLNAPLYQVYGTGIPHGFAIYDKDFFKVVDEQIKIEKFTIKYNAFVDKFKENLQQKKANLLQLSGLPKNGLQIIN